MTRIAAVFIAAAVLAGCQTTTPQPVVQTEVVEPRIPPALLHCRDEPKPPPKPAKQGQAARYVLDLAEAGRDCRGKLAAVRQEVEREDEAR